MMKKLLLLILLLGGGSMLRTSHAESELLRYNLTIDAMACGNTEDVTGADEYYVAGVFVAFLPDGSSQASTKITGVVSINDNQLIANRNTMFENLLPRGSIVYGQMRFYDEDIKKNWSSVSKSFDTLAASGLSKAKKKGVTKKLDLVANACSAFQVFSATSAGDRDDQLGMVNVSIVGRGNEGNTKFRWDAKRKLYLNVNHPAYKDFAREGINTNKDRLDYLEYYSGDMDFSRSDFTGYSSWAYTQSWLAFIQDPNLDPKTGEPKPPTPNGNGNGTGGEVPPVGGQTPPMTDANLPAASETPIESSIGQKMAVKLEPKQIQDFNIDFPAGDYLVLSDIACREGLNAWFDLFLLKRSGTGLIIPGYEEAFMSWSTNEHFWRQGKVLSLTQPLQGRLRLQNTGSSPTNNWLFVVPVNSAFVPFGFDKPVGVAAVGADKSAGGTLNWNDVAFARATLSPGKWKITLTGKYPKSRVFASLIALDANGLLYDFDTTIISADDSGSQASAEKEMEFEKSTPIIFRVWNEGAAGGETLSYNITIKKSG